jgi:predicted outer membrane protein
MKLPALSTICLLATASFGFAQAPAAPAAPGAAPATTAAEKPKPLTATDKAFLNKVLDSILFETKLTDKHKAESAKLEDTKKVAAKINTDLNKVWGELAGLLDPKDVPSDLAGGDKSKAQRLSKAGDKYDKELLEILEKETKTLERAFESASKNSQHATIKQTATNWLPSIRGHQDEIAKALKAAEKK